jgi:hypothetical protein
MRTLGALLLLFIASCSEPGSAPPPDWKAWAVWVEARYPVGDPQGHGPDIGSDEWAQALQQKLGIVDAEGHGPDPGSEEWRAAVERKLQGAARPSP